MLVTIGSVCLKTRLLVTIELMNELTNSHSSALKLTFGYFVRYYCHFGWYRRRVGKGRVGHGFDLYLLDNRNRTQKWDE